MTEYFVYETHPIANPLLPFILHRQMHRTGPCHRINWHENLEFLYCAEGEGFIQCGPSQHRFQQGDLFIVNADTFHSIGSNRSVTYHCLIVDNAFAEENGIPINTLYFQNTVRDSESAQHFGKILQAFTDLDAKNPLAVAKIRLAVLDFLCHLCNRHTLPKDASSVHADSHIKQAIIYIRNHFNKPIALDDLAVQTGLSKYHLSRRFKAATGKTIIETTNLIRCLEAKRLMEKGSSVSAAALSCGFENLSYFSRTYKRLMGELPSTVKKE